MISFNHSGDFRKTEKFFRRGLLWQPSNKLKAYAAQGTAALSAATPIDTGKTANSWTHKIEKTRHGWSISWYNSNVNDGVVIALILQYGHGTKNGAYVAGRDYINPAIQPIFDQMAAEAWKEVTE